MNNFDAIVIGAGPGGYVSAIRLAQLGLKTAIVERDNLGGICLNWGCIPTKALLKSAELYTKIKHAESYGISMSSVTFDIKKIVDNSVNISKQLVSGIGGLLKKNKITLITGTAKFLNSNEIEVSHANGKDKYKAKNFVIATGARARILGGYDPSKNPNIWSYKEALRPEVLPKSIVIVGSGAIGIEFASFYNALGSDVTVLEAKSSILPVEDKEISAIARKAFESKGIKFFTDVNLISQQKIDNKVSINFKVGSETHVLEAEKLLMAVGIVANTENLGLENTKVKLDKGNILVDDSMRTNDPTIYAIGDVAGSPWLAHKASHEGVIAAEIIAGKKAHKIKKSNIPGCTYSFPQIASVGLTEAAAIEQGFSIKVGKFPFYGNGKALILGDKDGLIKTIFDAKTGELIGAHMIGSDVTEMISAYLVGKEMEATEADFINTIFPHPTLSEMMHESVLHAFGRQIHI